MMGVVVGIDVGSVSVKLAAVSVAGGSHNFRELLEGSKSFQTVSGESACQSVPIVVT